MTGFIQIIEFQSSQGEALQALMREAPDDPDSTAVTATIAEDHDKPGHYFVMVEFDSYESAMENSARPETDAFAKKMAALCDGPPTFYDLDVIDRMEG